MTVRDDTERQAEAGSRGLGTASGSGGVRRVMISGSRGWTDEDAVYVALDELLRRFPDGFELMHGGAAGPDIFGYRWALNQENVIGRTYSPAYAVDGAAAPHVRNDLMLSRADYLIAFWNGKSRGTKSVIDKAVKRGIAYEVHAPAGVEIGV